MENLQTSRTWRRKINGSSMALGQDCADVLRAQARHTASLYVRLEDYSEIFAAAASACSIPVLDLSPVENGFEKARRRGEVDYSDVFGSFGGRVFAGSFEELMVETKRSGVSSEEKRTRRDSLFEQQEKEASEHHPRLYTEKNESNLELNQHSSASKQAHIKSKQFGMSSCRMSRETIDKVSSDKTHGGPADVIPGYTFDAASNSIRQSKNNAANHGNADTSGTEGYVSDAGQNDEATVCFSCTPKSFVANIQASQTPLEPSCASLLDPPENEKKKSQSYSCPSASSGDIPMYEPDYLNISEISLQTEPFIGPPPSREPPKLPAKTDHPNVFRTCSRADVEEGRSLKSAVDNLLLSRCEATQVNTTDEIIKDIPFLRVAEMDPNSAAAVSMAAIKEAMELAQVRLASAKKMMDRKRDINRRKVGQPKVMISKEDDTACGVDLKSCTQVININNLLKEGNMNSECLFVEREEIRSAGKVLSNYENKKLLLPSYIKNEISKEDDMAYELELKSCSQVIDTNNLLKMSNANGDCTFVERKEIRPAGKTLLNTEDKKILLPSYIKDAYLMNQNATKSFEMAHNLAEIAGEWKMDKDYFKLIRNNKLLNTVKSIYIQRNEAAICSCEGQEICSDIIKQSNKVKDCIEKFEKGNKLKGSCMDSTDVLSKIFVDATMDEYLVKSHGSEITEAHCFSMPDENQKQIEVHNDNNKESMVTELGSVMDPCLYKENEIKLQNSSLDFNSGLANGFCEVKELKAVEGVSHYVECKKEFNVSRLKCELNKSCEEMRVSNETHLHGLFEKEIKMPVELWTSNAFTKMKQDEEVRPCYVDENETRIMKHQIEIREIDNTPIDGEGDGLQINFEAHALVENEIEQEAIQNENGLEKPKRQESIEDAELEHTISSKERVYCKEYNEKETKDAQTALQKGEKLMEGDCKVPVELSTSNASDKEFEEIRQSHTDDNETRIMKHLFEIQETDNISIKDQGDELKINSESHPLVESVLEQKAIQVENGLENPRSQGKIEDAELEPILNSRVGAHCNDYNEKETRDAQNAILEDENLTEGHMNSDFVASVEGISYRSVSEILTQDTLHNNMENQICSNLADDVCQLNEVDAQGFLSAKESNWLPTDHDATEDSHAEMAGNHKHSFCTEMEENKRNSSVVRDKANELETRSEEKEMERKSERDRIIAEREEHEACQQAIAKAQKRAERIAVERVIDEARERACAEALEKAEKAEAEKASREARLRAERVAVERATEEARKRAVEKALAEKAAADARERTAQASTSYKDSFRKDNTTEHLKFTHFKASFRKDDRSENFKFPHFTVGSEARHKHSPPRTQWNSQSQSASFANDHRYSNSHNNRGTDSNLRHERRQERQQQTSERATKALSERSMLDVLAQRAQSERDRMAESLNVEVRRWSNGKDGNLRALLSTLQFILGPDSGWQPIPITDIINVSSVKKAYRKATLCVHPDKLQQRGASVQQKYVCEKVFDLLQEAWSKFNSEER